MGTTQHRDPAVTLDVSESWALVREAVVGRLAVVTIDQLSPDVFPVNHVVDHGSVVFRTAPGTKLSAAVDRPVAFEVDGYDPDTGVAWSVVIKGIAREVRRLYDVVDAIDLPLFPWHAAPKPRIVRIEPEEISGRRFHILDRPAQVPPRRAAPE